MHIKRTWTHVRLLQRHAARRLPCNRNNPRAATRRSDTRLRLFSAIGHAWQRLHSNTFRRSRGQHRLLQPTGASLSSSNALRRKRLMLNLRFARKPLCA